LLAGVVDCAVVVVGCRLGGAEGGGSAEAARHPFAVVLHEAVR
jgi:hypothetical protein